MAGRRPDYDVSIAVNYGAKGNEKTSWHNVGAAWVSENGFIQFNLITNPGVKFVLCPKKEGENTTEPTNGG